LSFGVALVVSSLLLLVSGYDPIQAMRYFFAEPLTETSQIANLVVTATPLLILAMSTILAFRAGFVNIGQEGQIYLGACAGTIAALQVQGLPGPLMIVVALVAGTACAALWSGIAGTLKATLGVDEIVTTLMLNYIAILLTRYVVGHWFQAPGIGIATDPLPAKAWWPNLPGSTTITYGTAIAVLLTAVTWGVLFRTTWGMRLRALGSNARFAEAIGVRRVRLIIIVSLISGAIGGLAGINLVLGGQHQFVQTFSPGYGFAGLAVALLARLNPIGAVLTALLYAALLNGSATLQIFTEVPPEFVNVLIGLVVLLVTARWRSRDNRKPVD
jgi:simple sugar transport system permease protein